MLLTWAIAGISLLLFAPERGDVDPQLAAAIEQIRAIDNHAHPVRATGAGETDTEYDALPVENMEPSGTPVRLRDTENPEIDPAWRELKKKALAERRDGYPEWVLDRAGIEIMLANRVAMGPSIARPRFAWVPYVDALLFPFDNSALASETPDRRLFFALEDKLRARYLKESGLAAPPATLEEYLRQVVTPVLERHRKGGAVAEKFEAAYLRALDFGNPSESAAARVYAEWRGKGPAPSSAYKTLQDFLFRYIARECGRLGMAVHLHVMAGGGGYFHIGGADPRLLEPVLNDATLRNTAFVLVHGGWPYVRETGALLTKPNVYADISAQSGVLYPATLAATLREWLEWMPEKVLFGTDAYPYSDSIGWEETAWMASRTARQALAIALTGMMRDGEINRGRALELARLVLRENARKLYGF